VKKEMKKKPAGKARPAGPNHPKKVPGTGSGESGGRRATSYATLLIAGLCCLLYGNTLLNGYALDDRAVITDNSLTKQGFGGIGELITHDHFYGFNKAVTGLYRPIPLITHAVEYEFAGPKPAVSHLVNLALYILACLALYHALKEMLAGLNPLLPLIAVALFAVHPVHTEVVANIKGRDELLNLVFLSLSLTFSFRFIRSGSPVPFALSLFFFLLALLSKESAMTFVVVIPLALWFFGKARPVKLLAVMTVLVLVAGVMTIHRNRAWKNDFTLLPPTCRTWSITPAHIITLPPGMRRRS
jgi:hypothetical protein